MLKVTVYMRMTARRTGPSPELTAAVEGFKRHGIKPTVVNPGRAVPCDLAVVWGVRKKMEMASGRRCLVFERGYVGDRFFWTSAGFDGLNGRADFCNQDMPGDRWEKHFAKYMRPWRGILEGGDVLIASQVPGDASLRGLNIRAWCMRVQRELQHRGIPSYIRPHPASPMGKLRTTYGDLNTALHKARWVVTYNSNTSVNAVLEGIPTVVCDQGSMAWPVAGHVPTDPPPMPDRTQWAYNLAYAQWSMEEIKRGDTWDHLKRGM